MSSGLLPDAAVTDLSRALDLVGVAGNAILGGTLARARQLDAVGFVVLAIVSGLGGGMIRDTLLQRGTPVALTDAAYLLTALGAALVVFLVHIRGRWWERSFRIIDATALGCWATVGADRTLAAGLGWLPAILLGTITAVGGGLTRDVLLRQVPAIFGGNTLYATCAAVASATMVVLSELGHRTVGILAATAVGMLLCLLAQHRGWQAPLGRDWVPPSPRSRRGDRRQDDPG